MAQSILQIILKVTKEGTGDKEAAAAAKELKGNLKDLGLGALASVTPLAAATATVTALGAFTAASVTETIKYADEVRNMSMLTGQSAEEASRLLQVMDDLKVETSTLSMATKTLAKEGLTMNIETLAKLSDEYNKLGTGAQKTAFLVTNFGKSGMAMAEAMGKGGSTLRSMNSAVEANLILNQRGVDSARLYQAQIDNLNDAWLGVKVAVGNQAIPVLNDVLGAITANINKDREWSDLLRLIPILGTVMGLQDLRSAHEKNNPVVDSATQSYIAMAKAMGVATTDAEAMAEAEKAAAEAAKEMTKENQQLLSAVSAMQSTETSYAEQVRTLAEERKTIERDKAAAIAAGWSTSSEKIAEYDAALDANSKKAQDNANEHDLASKKIILGIIQQKLTADGILTDAETNWLLKKGQEWGIYSATVVTEAQKAIAEANKINDAINGITSSKTVAINIVASGYQLPSAKKSGLAQWNATGTNGWETVPAGFPGDTFPVYMTSGERYAVIPSGASGNTGGSGASFAMSVNYSPMVSLADASQLQAMLYPAFMGMIQRAKSDGALR